MYKRIPSIFCILTLCLLVTPAFGAADGEDQPLQSMVSRLSAFFQPPTDPRTGDIETKEMFEQKVIPLFQIIQQSLTDDQVHTFLTHILKHRPTAAVHGLPLYDWFDTMLQSFLQLLPTSEGGAVIDIDPTLQTLDTVCTNATTSQHNMPMTLGWWLQTHAMLHMVCQGDDPSITQAIQWGQKFLRDGMNADHAGNIFHTVATFIMNTEAEEDLERTALAHALTQVFRWQTDEIHTNLKDELLPNSQL